MSGVSTTGEVIPMDQTKPFPWSVITVTDTAALKMNCPKTGVSGNNIRAISLKYRKGRNLCRLCLFEEQCREYMKTKH